jgi:uncharacterized membrane protein (Fun14 family)
MTELVVTSASAAIAFLVLYGAAVIFTLERIGDRFGHGLLRGFLVGWAAPWFLCLVALVLVGLVIIALPDSPAKIAITLLDFVVGSVAVGFACYRTWRAGSDVRGMLALARNTPDRAETVREILWRAVERADVPAVGLCLRAFDKASPESAAVLGWLLGHSVVQDRDWLTTEILNTQLEGGLDELASKGVNEPLVAILDSALRGEKFELVYRVIDGTMNALEAAVPFTDHHGQLMADIGSTTWLVGDYRGTAPRAASVPAQLDYVKGIYGARRKDIWRAILRRGEVKGVESFVTFLCLSAEDTEDRGSIFSIYTDILMDGAPAGILTLKQLRELANSMRFIRLRDRGKAFRHEPDTDGFTLGDPGDLWNDLFLMVVDAAQKSGLADNDIAELAGTYGAYADPDFMRKVRGKDGRLDGIKGVLERILRQ